jgi:hypothetical protein
METQNDANEVNLEDTESVHGFNGRASLSRSNSGGSSPSPETTNDIYINVSQDCRTRKDSFTTFQSLLTPGNDATENAALSELNLGLFWQWILCFCIVNFDLETGQQLEYTYPPIQLSDMEKKTM